MAPPAAEALPVITEDGVVRFSNVGAVKEAIPKLRRGSLTVTGKSPPKGSHVFQLMVEGGATQLSAKGDVVATIGGRAVLFFADMPKDLLIRLEASAAKVGAARNV